MRLFDTEPTTGAGVRRARARLAAIREKNRLIPDGTKLTRQQKRRRDIEDLKAYSLTPAEVHRRSLAARQK